MTLFANSLSATAMTKGRLIAQHAIALSLLSLVLLLFSPTTEAQVVEIGNVVLDSERINGKKWRRLHLETTVSGSHTIRVSWDSDADIRFSIFEAVDAPSPDDRILIDRVSGSNSPLEWTGTLTDTQQYFLGVWSASGSANVTATIEAETVVPKPPTIVSQPANLTVTEGDDATFSVAATGAGTLNHQWLANGQTIVDATDSTLVISATTLDLTGTTYSVVIADDTGSVTSDDATLTVNEAPVALAVTAQPIDLTVTEGDDAIFSVTATGTGTLNYQWLADGQSIVDATDSTLVISATTLDLTGTTYSVVITDDNGSVTSDDATLTVNEAPVTLAITTQPADLTVTEGEDATFIVAATGAGTLNYQWLANGQTIVDATDSTLIISATTLDLTGTTYSVVITDDNGSVTSDDATLTVSEAPVTNITVNDVIDYDIADFTNVQGRKFTRVNFMPKASGDVTIVLEWDGSEEMNLSVFESDSNIRLATALDTGVNLKQITLTLDADTQYHANAWINSGTANWVMRRVQDIPDPDININNASDNATKPNIVLINTDDQRDDTLDRLPAIQQYLSQKGVTYTNAIVPTPSCCPSRATLLSGQYIHNNGQIGQQTENTPIFEKTINKYLQQEGYFTGTAGKYLHWIDADEPPAPYWDRWTNIKGGFYGISMNFDGDLVKPGGYTTDIVFERTKDYLRDFEAQDDDKPWFVYLAPMAPHSPYTAEYDLRNEPVAPYVTNPAYQEDDVSDKPGFIRFRLYDDPTSRDVFEKRVRSMYSVDREVEQLVEYLEASGELDNTMIIFTSDNGYMLGEHQTKGKFTPWRKSVQVPLIISWPGQVPVNVTNDAFVSHVDISRTILETAGVDTSGLALDGHNIFEETRNQFYMEYFYDPASNSGRIESWASIRTLDYQYTEWYDKNNEDLVSFREYYDMNVDPFQVNNLLGNADPDDDPDYTQLSTALSEQRSCSGISCTVEVVPIIITSKPSDQTVTEGEAATFTVVATGSGTLTYQWYANGEAIIDATDSTLNISVATLADSGIAYSVAISDDNGTLAFSSVILTVEPTPVPLIITSQPTDVTVAEGDNATFTVVAIGTGTLYYQWSVNGEAIPDATESSLKISAVTLDNSGNVYRVEITDDSESVGYASATLTVNEAPVPPSITTQPADLTVTEGESASFTVAATGTGTLTYQWFVNGDAIPEATTETLFISLTSLTDDLNVYRVDITDDNGSTSSDDAVLDVLEIPAPVTVSNIAQGTVDSDKNAGPRWVRLDFDSLAMAVHTITVSWDSDADVRFNVREADGTRISSTLQGSNPGVWSGELQANTPYYLALWSRSGIANYTVTIEAAVPLSIQSQPSGLIVTEGDSANFVVEASGSGTLSYQWFADGAPLPGETADSLTVFATSVADDGTAYTVQISNGFESVTSDAAILTVNAPVVLGLFSQEADTTAWILAGPAPTLDYQAEADTDAWGRSLLRVGDVLLVGGDFTGIKPTRSGPVTDRPFLAAFDAVSGQPVTSFQVPFQVDSVVRALVRSPDGNHVYVGGDFGLLILDAITGEVDVDITVSEDDEPGRVFDVEVTNTQVYIGGDFNKVNSTFRANIARLSLNGELDTTWDPKVANGFSGGRSAPVQALAVSTNADTVYVGGNFGTINGIPVDRTPQDKKISMLAVSAIDGSVKAERFIANVESDTRSLTVHDIATTDNYVIIAWGGPNYLSFHSPAGDQLKQYRNEGDVQALQIVGNHLLVGHHGEFFGTQNNPIPPEAVESIDPQIFIPYKFHSFRIDDPEFPPEQAWPLSGAFGVWGIAAAEDSVWVAGQLRIAGSNDRNVDGLVRFPALD